MLWFLWFQIRIDTIILLQQNIIKEWFSQKIEILVFAHFSCSLASFLICFFGTTHYILRYPTKCQSIYMFFASAAQNLMSTITVPDNRNWKAQILFCFQLIFIDFLFSRATFLFCIFRINLFKRTLFFHRMKLPYKLYLKTFIKIVLRIL